MSDIIPFANNENLPAYLQQETSENNDLTAHGGSAFATISIKGKVFTLVQGDERRVVPNPRDPESPATNIQVALVKVSPNKSKTYYANGYQEGAEDHKPTCFSNDGVHPDPTSSEIQCKTCAACPWNKFGSARGQNGQVAKGKACSDFIRIAVAFPSNLQTPFLLRVPPASIRAVGDYGSQLNRRKVPYRAVLTKIGFDPEAPTPKLTFSPVGYFDQPSYVAIEELSKCDDVKRMIEGAPSATADAPQDDFVPNKTVSTSASAPVVEHQAKPVQTPAPTPAVKAEPATTEEKMSTTADDIIAKAMAGASTATAVASSEADLGSMLDDLGFE